MAVTMGGKRGGEKNDDYGRVFLLSAVYVYDRQLFIDSVLEVDAIKLNLLCFRRQKTSSESISRQFRLLARALSFNIEA